MCRGVTSNSYVPVWLTGGLLNEQNDEIGNKLSFVQTDDTITHLIKDIDTVLPGSSQ